MIIGLTGLPPAGSGKDTVADYLVNGYGLVKIALADPMKRFCMEMFQWSVRDLWGPSENRNVPDDRYPRHKYDPMTSCNQDKVVGKYFDTDDGRKFEPMYLAPRHALQQLGTEWGRSCYENVWVDYCLRVAEDVLDPALDITYDPVEGPFRCPSPRFIDLGDRWGKPRDKGVVIPDVRYDNEAAAIRKAGGKVWLITRPDAGLKGEAAKHSSENGVSEEHIDYCIKNDRHYGWLFQQVRTLMNERRLP